MASFFQFLAVSDEGMWVYISTEEPARSVNVASNAILEALRKVYKADWLLGELGPSYP